MKTTKYIATAACALATGLSAPCACAGAGHDHGDAPATLAGKPLPSVTAASASFELVGRLTHDELSILVDRRDTTEPVLDASLSVEVEGRSAVAPFHADHGDYALTDEAILGRLRQAGSKPLTFTLVAGRESDLLTGDLDVHEETEAAPAERLHGWREYGLWAGGGLAGLAALLLAARRLQGARRSLPGGAA